jgi:hypothetical protein
MLDWERIPVPLIDLAHMPKGVRTKVQTSTANDDKVTATGMVVRKCRAVMDMGMGMSEDEVEVEVEVEVGLEGLRGVMGVDVGEVEDVDDI